MPLLSTVQVVETSSGDLVGAPIHVQDIPRAGDFVTTDGGALVVDRVGWLGETSVVVLFCTRTRLPGTMDALAALASTASGDYARESGRLDERLARMADVLRRVQWIGKYYRGQWEEEILIEGERSVADTNCPVCERVQNDGHTDGCELRAVLERADEATP